MKTALRIMIAVAVATMFAGGGLAGTVAAQETIDQDISDDDLVDADANVLNPTTATSVNAINVGSGDQVAASSAEADNIAGDDYDQDADLD